MLRFVLFVVDVADGPPLDVLAVARMLDQPRNLDPARLVHLVAGDDADFDAGVCRDPSLRAIAYTPLRRCLVVGLGQLAVRAEWS